MNDDPRPKPSQTAGERDSLVGFLDYQRATLAWKCSGLTAEQLKSKAVPPSSLSLLALVRHAAEVERSWFQVVWSGRRVPPHWPGMVNGTYAEFDVEGTDVDEAFTVWETACETSRAAVAAAALDDMVTRPDGGVCSLRYIVTHLIEEYAWHNGHADLLREAIDGTVGE